MDINILLSFSGNGGVEKMAVNLMQGFLDLNLQVNLYRIKTKGRFVKNIPTDVKIIQLPFKQTFLNIPYMIKIFKKNKIDSLLVMKERAGIMAIIAKLISGTHTKIFIRFGTHIRRSLLEKNKSKSYIALRLSLLKKFLPYSKGIIGVSKGVIEDIVSFCPDIQNKCYVIKNPTIVPEIFELSKKEINHKWLSSHANRPVIIGVGRLTYQKDFETLIKAFFYVNKKLDSRLLIMGQGELKKQLEELSINLGIREKIDFLGFKKNPYPYLKKADLFVLSSRWEGSPNALVEALALGTPVVSTDCETGPREILKNGELGPLVPIGNPVEMSKKMLKVLQNPPDKDKLIEGVREFHYLTSAKNYLKLMQG